MPSVMWFGLLLEVCWSRVLCRPLLLPCVSEVAIESETVEELVPVGSDLCLVNVFHASNGMGTFS